MPRFFREKTFYHPFLICLIVLCWYGAVGGKLFSGPARALQSLVGSQAFWLFNHPPACADKITIVAIDEDSRRRLGMKWPWKRSVTARMLQNIAACGPRVIGLDIVFSGAGELDEDRMLLSTLQTQPSVVLGYLRRKGGNDGPEEPFARAARGMGFVNKPLDRGAIKSVWTYRPAEDGPAELSIEIAILAAYFGLNRDDIQINARGIRLGDRIFIPSPAGRMPLNYLVYHTGFRMLPAHKVLENSLSASDFRNKIVLVGATDPLLHDEFLTPLGNFPGVTILANALTMLLSGRFVRAVPVFPIVFGALVICALIIAVNRWLGFVGGSLVTGVFLGLLYMSFVALRAQDLALPCFFILFSTVSAYLAFNGYKYATLLYVTSRLKTEAVMDPLTGLYAPRFFCLQLREKARSRQPLACIGLKIADYERLGVQFSFEELQKRVKQWSEFIAEQAAQAFRKVTIGRLSKDTVGIIVEAEAAGKTASFVQNLLERAMQVPWGTGSAVPASPLRACLIRKDKDRACKDVDVMGHMEDLFNSTKKTQIYSDVFREAGSGPDGRVAPKDELDFIAFDWQERNKELERSLRDLLETNKKLDRLNWGALKALARAIDAKSPWTAGHSERVTALALRIGQALNLDQEDLDVLNRAGLLHDIGKIATPADILDKPGKLTQEERRIICEHPATGARILEPIEDFAAVIPIAMQHHEWFNGNGYPDGLTGGQISPGARILAVADVFDALTSDRPYRAGMHRDKAIRIIRDSSGTQFDPRVVEAFLKTMSLGEKRDKADMHHQLDGREHQGLRATSGSESRLAGL